MRLPLAAWLALVALFVGGVADAQPTSSRVMYLTYVPLNNIRRVLSNEHRFNLLLAEHPAALGLRTFVQQRVKENPNASVAVLILHLPSAPGERAFAEYKEASDTDALGKPLDWDSETTRGIAALCQRFVSSLINHNAALAATKSISIQEGWAKVKAANDDAFLAPEYAANLAEQFVRVVYQRDAEYAAVLKEKNADAAALEAFFKKVPRKLTDGDFETKPGVLPRIDAATLKGFEKSMGK